MCIRDRCKGDWNGEMEAISCTSVGFNLSHRPGFYAISKKYLYIDDVFQDQNVPASIGTGNIMKPYLLMYKEASTSSDVYWWANQSVNKQVAIVGEEGDFYKISFQSSHFLKKRRVCYIQKKYVNAQLNGVSTVSYTHLIYYLSISFLFVFLTIQKVRKQRWS